MAKSWLVLLLWIGWVGLTVRAQLCGNGNLTSKMGDNSGDTTVYTVTATGWPTSSDLLPAGTVIEMESPVECRCFQFFGQVESKTQGSVYQVKITTTNANQFTVICYRPMPLNGTYCAPKIFSFDHIECSRPSTRINLGGSKSGYYEGGDTVTVTGGTPVTASSQQVPFSSGLEGEMTLSLPLEDGVYKVFLPMLDHTNDKEGERLFNVIVGDTVSKSQYIVSNLDIVKEGETDPIYLDLGNINVVTSLEIRLTKGSKGLPLINGIIATKVGPLAVAQISPDSLLQRVVGFGANMIFFLNWVTNHPNREKIYDLIFKQLRPQMLRIRNDYDAIDGPSKDIGPDLPLLLKACREKMGYIPYTLMGSWGAPHEIMDNQNLKKHSDGSYYYQEYAKFWNTSLDFHARAGVYPNVVFVQNEPDYYDPVHETTRLDPFENANFPGYGVASSYVYEAFKSRSLRPMLVGPDTTGLNYSALTKYFPGMNLSQFKVYTHHIYSGGDFQVPDSFEFNFKEVARGVVDKEKWMTEYSRWLGKTDSEDYLKLAWTMHNTMAWEKANTYMHWDLFWAPENSSLVAIENPWDTSTWTTKDGFYTHQSLYTLMLWTRYVRYGWHQMVSSTTLGEYGTLRMTAWKHPFDLYYTVILFNLRSDPYPLTLSGLDKLVGANVICTNSVDKAQLKYSVPSTKVIRVPGKTVCAVTTLRA